MHKNTEIRNKLLAILTDTSSGATAYNSRLRAISDKSLPAISIYTNNESTEKLPGEGAYIRNVQVIIVLYVIGKDRIGALSTGEKSVDEKLDDLLEFVELKLLTQYQNLDKVVYRFDYEGVSNIQAEDKGTEGIKLIAFTQWNARYHYSTIYTANEYGYGLGGYGLGGYGS